MPEPQKFRVRLPSGQATKPYSKAKITSAVEAGKLPLDAVVETPNGEMGIQDFCFGDSPAVARPESRKPRRDTRFPVTTNPKMFRNRPILFLLCVVLIIAYGAGLVILLVWWIQTKCTTLTITDKNTTLRRGILSKSINEVRHKDVRNVQVYQSFLQRILGVGRLALSSSGQDGLEIVVNGIRAPMRLKKLIDDQRD